MQLALERGGLRRGAAGKPYEYPQASACFIQSVGDNMEDIMELARSEAMLFKFGSGTGTDLSTLRSHRERLSGGGRPSGPLSFMRVYDQIAAVVKSGGKTRRAAKMQSIKDWHPDVLEFIECKNREEKKVRTLVEQGYDPQDAYDTVLFQNANLSVRLSDEFMQNVETDKPWTTHWVTQPDKAGPAYRPARCSPKWPIPPGAAAIPGAVRHDHQPLAHLPQLRPDQRQQPLLRIHVPGRLGLQPGEHQPDDDNPLLVQGLLTRPLQQRFPLLQVHLDHLALGLHPNPPPATSESAA